MPGFRLVGAMHAVAIDRAGLETVHVDMPDFVGIFGQFDALRFLLAFFVEKAEFDLGGVRGKQREINAFSVPGRAERERRAFGNAEFVRHEMMSSIG